MRDVAYFFKLCSDCLIGRIQMTIIGAAFPIVLGFQIGNVWNIAPVFSNYSYAMGIVWRIDFLFTLFAVIHYAVRRPQEFFEYLRKTVERLLPR